MVSGVWLRIDLIAQGYLTCLPIYVTMASPGLNGCLCLKKPHDMASVDIHQYVSLISDVEFPEASKIPSMGTGSRLSVPFLRTLLPVIS